MQEKEIGTITHYFGKISVGILKLEYDGLRVGDSIRIKGLHDDFQQKVDSIQIEHQSVQEAKKGDVVGIKVIQKVHPNDKVYKIIE